MAGKTKRQREPMSKMEAVYYKAMLHWMRHHPNQQPPTPGEIGSMMKPARHYATVRSALLALESKGWLLRNDLGKFEVIR